MNTKSALCSALVTLAILLLSVGGYTAAQDTTQTPTATPPKRFSIPTVTPTPCDFGTVTPFKSEDGTIEVLLREGWMALEKTPLDTVGELTVANSRSIIIFIHIENPEPIFSPIIQSSGITPSIHEVLEYLVNQNPGSFGEIFETKIGKYPGYGVQSKDPVINEFRLAQLEDGKIAVVYMVIQTTATLSEITIAGKIIESIVLHPELVPTISPLMLTATVLQRETYVHSLTTKMTETPEFTGTP
jgi:hypothetical protein